MKVNISGVGLIPRVSLLAPVYGKDLTKDTVAVILNYASFKVYQASTGIRITKKNIDEVFSGAVKQAATVAPVTAPAAHTVPKKTKKASKVEAPVEIEQVAEPVVLDTVVEAPAIEEPVEAVEVVADTTDAEIESSFVDDVETVKDQLDEAPAEEEEKPVYNKKKKRH